MFDYYYGPEAEQFTFYRVPKVLFTADCVREISTDAKLLYGLLLDRMQLSAKNGWFDENGRVYIYYTVRQIMDALGCGNKKVTKLLYELETTAGLIERSRVGFNKPDRIYVKNFLSVVSKQHFQSCQKDITGDVEMTSMEVSKAHTNNTDTNHTEYSDTNPIVSEKSGYDGMVYTQLFNLLCERADDLYHGRLPVHVRCLIDEAANIGQIPNLEKLVATIRSREISACLVLQARSQLKAIYKDHADTIVGNMDSQLFLGGSEPTTLKDLSQALGKETIDTYNTGETRGREQSHSMNYNKLGKELMTVDELAVMDGSKCILQLRGVRPFLSDKYDLTKHPNYRLTSDYDKRNYFDIEKFLKRKLKLNMEDVYEVIDADALGDEDSEG